MSAGNPLQRFVDAQDAEGAYDRALAELRRGRKTSHWIWFVLPQVAGLGQSEMSRRYALAGVDEARAYLAHPVLGPRLRETTDLLLATPSADPVAVLGTVDAVKVRSAMTLFAQAAPDEPAFRAVLERWYDGVEDDETLRRL
ncbi:DUF1810 domain-containing protein [Cellulomonas marina]|uniref:Uncharacterized protein, DUF1810 family n=1 Tax=Cellulomonas marina TaxID=988821 RepID=A0A1I1AA37_9CELL|nr:DUF1810 domain-containing protein [Cellulomonas marina]GIG30395.1 hypothetical protein Cma02nite_29950 [Cellulomonas marina]SFB34839.1 Uncharacterized protein, DUF1810 family [Cellulomonas marina]